MSNAAAIQAESKSAKKRKAKAEAAAKDNASPSPAIETPSEPAETHANGDHNDSPYIKELNK
jgi:hypothetical protein